jgi:hypothetical protein
VLTVLILLNLFFALVFRAVDFAKADLNAQTKEKALGKKILATEKEREESRWISLRDGEYAVEFSEFESRTRAAARGASLVFSVPLTPAMEHETADPPPSAP